MTPQPKTLAEIKDEVATNHGYADWLQIDMTDREQWEKEEIKASMLDEIAERYAAQFRNEWISFKEDEPALGLRILAYDGVKEIPNIDCLVVTRSWLKWRDLNGYTHWQITNVTPPEK